MDQAHVKAIVDRELEPMMNRLGLAHWRVRVTYTMADADADGLMERGQCTRVVDYNLARIGLNPDAFDDEDEVIDTLRHELLHVVLGPFDLYSSTVDRLDLSDPLREVMNRVWMNSVEQAVINLERLMDGIDVHEPKPKRPKSRKDKR